MFSFISDAAETLLMGTRTGSLLVCSGDVQSTAMAGHICACPKFASAEIDSSATRKVKSEVYIYMYIYICIPSSRLGNL